MATPTELLYFGDTFRFECESRVLSVELIDSPDTAPPTNTKQYAVVLDKTVAYPVGGGQPSDVGKVVCASSETSFSLQRVVAGKDGVVRHVGVFGIPGEETTAESKKGDLNNQFKPGDTVTVTIDQEKRMLHARIHSAGHLLDVAMGNVGYPSRVLRPAKGLHSVDQAYVEYDGKVTDTDELVEVLNAEMKRLVESGGKTCTKIMAYDDARKACGGFLPSFVDPVSHPRVVVILNDTEGCPCGGTHVGDVGDIGVVTICAIRVKKKVTRVSYAIQGMTRG